MTQRTHVATGNIEIRFEDLIEKGKPTKHRAIILHNRKVAEIFEHTDFKWVATRAVIAVANYAGVHVSDMQLEVAKDLDQQRKCTCDAGGSAGCPVHDPAVTFK